MSNRKFCPVLGILSLSLLALAGCGHPHAGDSATGRPDAVASEPGAPPLLVPVGPQAPGTYRLHSSVLDQERLVLIHLPEGYDANDRTFPVHYVLDGELLFPLVAATEQFLAEARVVDMLMPESIVVGVVSAVRDTDYTPTPGTSSEAEMFPNGGGGERFLQFLADELLPAVDADFRTNGYRVLTGWSFSGLFTIYTMTERPELFNAYHAISPSIWWDDNLVIDRFERQTFARPTKLFTSIGSVEAGGWTSEANKKLTDILSDHPVKNLDFTHIEIADVGHHLGVPQSIDRALKTLYTDYLAPDEVVEAGRSAIADYYGELSKEYGYDVPIPYRIYERLGMSFWQEGRDAAEAVDIFRECLETYPDYPVAHLLLGLSYEKIGDDERAANAIRQALEIESRRSIPDQSNLWLFQQRLDLVQPPGEASRHAPLPDLPDVVAASSPDGPHRHAIRPKYNSKT